MYMKQNSEEELQKLVEESDTYFNRVIKLKIQDIRTEERLASLKNTPISKCILVQLIGLEPTTAWFVARYSIQLSYSCIKNFKTKLV